MHISKRLNTFIIEGAILPESIKFLICFLCEKVRDCLLKFCICVF